MADALGHAPEKELRMLIDVSPPRASAAQLAELSDHLRMPEAIDADPALARLLASCAEAAALCVERRLGRTLFRRRFELRLTAWREDGALLPGGAVQSLIAVVLEDADGARALCPAGMFRLDRFARPPRLRVADAGAPPPIPAAGFAEIAYSVGDAETWEELPGDLRLAITLIAARFFDEGANARPPDAALALLAPHRPVRL